MSQPYFEIRGVVESFYGVFYTAPERDDLIRFLGRHGFNYYLYGPKNDRQHRARWREAYPERIMREFAQTVAIANEVGVTFCYSIAPGVAISYSSEADFDAITGKLKSFYDIGVRAFSISMDDISSEFANPDDRARYRSYAEAHVDLCNRIYEWLQSLSSDCQLSMCPTDYWGVAPFSDYLMELGQGLHPAIDVFYTGREVCAPTITAEEAHAFAQVVKRKPLIWDNYPANDLAMKAEMHIGAIKGRDPELFEQVRGLCVNPMNQAEASKIPLLTFADYMRDPYTYDPEKSWEQAVVELAGESAPAMRIFGENSRHSVLKGKDESLDRLALLTDAVLLSLTRGDSVTHNPFVASLQAYLTEIDEAGYHLKFRMENHALRNNLIPWIELLEYWMWAARYGLKVLEAMEKGEGFSWALSMMNGFLEDAKGHNKRVAGSVLSLLTDYVLSRVEMVEA
jgi:hyaluronoglucosaminidase